MSKTVNQLGQPVSPDEIPGNGIWNFSAAAAGLGSGPFSPPISTGGPGSRARFLVVHGRLHKLDAGGANVTLRAQGNFTGRQVASGTGASNTLHGKTSATASDNDTAVVATNAPEAQKTITAASNATPIVITSAAHGYSTGDLVEVASVVGNTAANGTWRVNVLTANTYELVGSVGNGNYVSGGVSNKHVFFSAIFSFGSSAANTGNALPIPYPHVNIRASNSGAAYTAGAVYVDFMELLE